MLTDISIYPNPTAALSQISKVFARLVGSLMSRRQWICAKSYICTSRIPTLVCMTTKYYGHVHDLLSA